MNTVTVHSSEEVEQIRGGVRDAAHLTRWGLSQLSQDPMEALYQLHFEQHGHNPLKSRPQSLREQTYRTFKVMTILAAADHILREFPACGGLYLRLAEEFPKNLGPFSIAPRAPEEPEIQSIREGMLKAEVFAATTSPNRITSNNVLRKKFRHLASDQSANRRVYFYWPRVWPEHRRNANYQRDLNRWQDPDYRRVWGYQQERQHLDDMKRRREREFREQTECRDDLARELYDEFIIELQLHHPGPLTPSVERAAGDDIQIWSLPLKAIL